MVDTAVLGLPLMAANQSQKHVTHNDALLELDILVQLTILDKDLSAPPGSPVEGDRYIVAGSPTGLWAGQANRITAFYNGSWKFFTAKEGWLGYVQDENALYVFNGTTWGPLSIGGGAIAALDEGVSLTTAVTSFNFVGAGVTATNTGGAVTVTIAGGGGGGSSFVDNVFEVTDNLDATKKVALQVSGVTTATTRTLTIPDASGIVALLDGGAQTFSTTTTFSAATNTLGSSTGASTANVGSGVTTTGLTKTVNLGTAGASGSTTVINIGSTVGGALGSLVVNSPTVTFAATVTAIGAAAANVSALRLGLGGATADATNQLSVNTPSVLFNRGTDTINVTLNKNASGNDARFTFQTAFSTRALFGTLANDDFTLSVSPDGTTFNNAFTALAASGDVTGLDVRANTFQLRDNTDRTKIANFDASGIATASTRTFTLPDITSTLAHLGNAAQTFAGATTFSNATLTIGTSTAASTIGIGTGATLAATTKVLNIGTGGVSTSVTNINIGSAVAGALGTLTVSSPTVTFASSVTSIGASAANVTALYLGLGGATADATNRLSINTPAVLLNNAGTSINMVFNKNAAANDATMTFQTGFSTRAIIGAAGDDNFTLKVSNNGSTFFNALTAIRTTGKLRADLALNLNPAAGDLASPVDGDLWYNSTTGKFRGRQFGTSQDIIGAGGGGVSDGDKGDITVTGSGTVWTLNPSAIFGLPIALDQSAYVH